MLVNSMVIYTPVRLTAYAVDDLSVSAAHNVSCSNSSDLQQLLISTTPASISCDGGVALTFTGLADANPVLMMAMGDPVANVPFVSFSPCGTSTYRNGGRVLIVDFTEKHAVPQLSLTGLSRSSTSISVAASTDPATLVSCGAFTEGATVVAATIAAQNSMSRAIDNQAIVNITGLTPSTTYMVFCMATSPEGVTTPTSDIVATRRATRTRCCRSVSIQLSVQEVALGYSLTSIGFLSVSPATSNLTISMFLRQSATCSDSNLGTVDLAPSVLSPSFLVGTASASITSSEIFLSGTLAVGCYYISATLGGGEAEDYGVTYDSSLQWVNVVDGTSSSIPSPVVKSVAFSSDGAFITIMFSRPTDQGGFNGYFSCVTLLEFAGAERGSCNWADESTISLAPGTLSSLSIGSFVRVRGGVIKAKCTFTSCAKSDFVAETAVAISAPLNLASPVVRLSVPAIVGQCDSVLVDCTGSSGSGGRPWASFNVSVGTEAPGQAQIAAFLNQNSTIMSTFTMPSWLFSPGYSYSLTVSACNFLMACGSTTARFVVSAHDVPVVFVLGSKDVSMNPKDVLSVSAGGYLLTCSGSKLYDLSYEWTLVEETAAGQSILDVKSTSGLSRVYMLPAYSLVAGRAYTLILEGTYGLLALKSSVNVKITVASGSIIPVIKGTAVQSLREGESLVLDASGSYDENQRSEALSGLIFSWSCKTLKPTLSAVCALVTSNDATSSLRVLAPVGSAGTFCSFTLTISDRNGRSASSAVQITVVALHASLVRISGPVALKINPRDALRLVGYVSPSTTGWAEWSVSGGFTDLADSVLTPIGQDVVLLQNFSFDFALSRGVLSDRSTYTISLSFKTSSVSSDAYASFVVTTNGAPLSGSLSASPSSGIAGVGYFRFAAFSWIDEDLPLSFEYALSPLDAAGSFLTLSSRKSLSYFSTVLPAGDKSMRYVQSIRLQVFDSLDASTQASVSVKVTPFPSDSNLTTVLANLNGDYADPDFVKLRIALIGASLNSANCSMAPNCSALNRHPCSTVAGTCGPCFSSAFTGVDGPSNSVCVPVGLVATRRALEQSLPPPLSSSSCGVCSDWQSCDEHRAVCQDQHKSCPNDCSGRGECRFMSTSWSDDLFSSLDSCGVLDSSCVAVCVCHSSYFGSDCAKDADAVSAALIFRENALKSLTSLVSMEYPTQNALTTWANYLAVVSGSSDEMSEASRSALTKFFADLINSARDKGHSVEDLKVALNALDSLPWSNSSTLNSALSLNADKNVSIFIGLDRIQKSVEMYYRLLLDEKVVGERIEDRVSDSYRVASVKSASSLNVSLSVPLSSEESLSGEQPHVVQLESSATPTAAGGIAVNLVALNRGLFYNPDFITGPVQLHFSSPPCQDRNCFVSVTFQFPMRTRDVIANATAAVEGGEYHSLQCTYGVTESKNISCSVGQNVSLMCNGTWSGSVAARCPARVARAVCNAVVGLNGKDAGCVVLSNSSSNITCRCPAFVDFSAQTSSVQLVAMLEYTAIGFVNTWKSAGDLSASSVQRSWIVLLSIGLVGVVTALMLGVGFYADSRMHKTKPAETAKLQVSHDPASELATVAKMIDNSLPNAFADIPMHRKVWREMKRHHKWLSILFHGSATSPRPTRIIAVASSVIMVMFGNAITYNLSYPDDGTCEGYKTEEHCIQDQSAFSGGSKCFWSGGECHFREPRNNFVVVVYVAIISAVFSIPLVLLNEYLINEYLLAKVKAKKSAKVLNEVIPVPADGADIQADGHNEVAAVGGVGTRDRVASHTRVVKNREKISSLHLDLSQLTADIRQFRASLSKDDKADFDSMWGTSDYQTYIPSITAGPFSYFGLSTADAELQKLIMVDLTKTRRQVLDELRYMNRVGVDIEERLLFLFQRDLMPDITGVIMESKGRREFPEVPRDIKMWEKISAWIVLLVVNLGILFYVYLFAMQQSSDRQSAWLISFILWLIFEVAVISTLVVFISNIFVPSLIKVDITTIKNRLTAKIIEFRRNIDAGTDKLSQEEPDGETFNAAKYFFVSYRVAEKFPDLYASRIIRQFSSPWPRKCYRKSSSVKTGVTFFLVFLIKGLISLPPLLQDALFKMIVTALMGQMVVTQTLISQFGIVILLIPVFVLCFIAYVVVKLCQWIMANVSERNKHRINIPASTLVRPPIRGRRTERSRDHSSSQLSTRRESVQGGIEVLKKLDKHVERKKSAISVEVMTSDEDKPVDSQFVSAELRHNRKREPNSRGRAVERINEAEPPKTNYIAPASSTEISVAEREAIRARLKILDDFMNESDSDDE
jgi:hypothetical protein